MHKYIGGGYMQSIMYKGIFTSHAFFAVIFIALGLFLFHKIRDKTNVNIKSDKKLYISGFTCIGIGIIFLIAYLIYLKSIFINN